MATNHQKRSGLGTRLIALFALSSFLGGVGYVGNQSYWAMTDSFVAPIILTPDNDLVIANKLKMSELSVERLRATTQIEALDVETAATEKALSRLRDLHATASNAIEWLKQVNANQAKLGAAERRTLARQKAVLTTMVDRQEQLVRDSRANMEAGLVSKTDYAKELQALQQMAIALLENDRSRLQSDAVMHQVDLAQKSLATRGGSAPMPELLVREDEVVRIELEILKLESDQRAKAAEKRILQEKVTRLDELEAQLRGRPIVRAIGRSMNVAFVPYTQIGGVREGAAVYDCTWGLFNCHPVGTVAEVVSGEVVLPDPWGNQARGQYAVLTLSEPDAAKARTLRVRGTRASQQSSGPTSDEAVSVR